MLNKQLELQFFWPLTEQIPLDLDFTECAKLKISTNNDNAWVFSNANYGTVYLGIGGTGGTTGPGTMELHAQNLVWKTHKKIPWWRKLLFKLMDIRLEQE